MGVLVRLHLRGVDVKSHPVMIAALGLVGAIALVVGLGADYAALASSPIGDMLGLPGGENAEVVTPPS